MVAHKAVGIELEAKSLAAFRERAEIVHSVEIAKEHIISGMPALDDVVWIIGECNAGVSRHPCLRELTWIA
jgi:hypothetical protein